MQFFKSITSLFWRIVDLIGNILGRVFGPIAAMDGLELNKIAASVLVAGIVAMVAGKAAQIVYHGEEEGAEPMKRGYTIAGAAEDTSGAAPAEEKPVMIALYLPKADKAKGEQIAKACQACHDFSKGGPNKVGPNLWGIVGNKHAHKDDYTYSKAISSLPGKWDYQSISEFITKPSKYAPGTKMGFAGLKKPEDRADVLAYLQAQADTPVPFPPPPAAGAADPAKAPPAGAANAKPGEAAAAGAKGAGESSAPSGEKAAAHPEQAGGRTETRSGKQSGAQTAKRPTDAAGETAQKGAPTPNAVGPSGKDAANVKPETARPQSAPVAPKETGLPVGEGQGTANKAAADKAGAMTQPGTTGDAGKHSTNPATVGSDAEPAGATKGNADQLPSSSAAPDAGVQGNTTSTQEGDPLK